MVMRRQFLVAAFGLTMALAVKAQTAPPMDTSQPVPAFSPAPATPQTLPVGGHAGSTAPLTDPLQPLLDFRDSDIKFNLGELMNNLRDNRHEGWVLAAYPDPKTSRPLIGAGFSLDVSAREHPQSDPFNPNQFLEPSSAQLWQAAGLEPAKLETILGQYDDEFEAWQKTKFRRKIRARTLMPAITDEEATQLLRISAIQAIHNARAYCRSFDELSGYQQMALSQLVFQMGVNLEEFTHFLDAINNGQAYHNPAYHEATLSTAPVETGTDHWKTVQSMLIQSDWARRYYSRAVSVIAMFDPNYSEDPLAAERRVSQQLHPLHTRSRRSRRSASLKTASATHKKSATRRTRQS
jgi:hypothetical protein